MGTCQALLRQRTRESATYYLVTLAHLRPYTICLFIFSRSVFLRDLSTRTMDNLPTSLLHQFLSESLEGVALPQVVDEVEAFLNNSVDIK